MTKTRKPREPPSASPPEAPRPCTKPGVWPDEVPVLIGADFCRGQNTQGARRDLMGWLEQVFDFDAISRTPCRNLAYNELLKLVRQRSLYRSVHQYNDASEVSADELATIWRDMLLAVGYQV